MKVLAIYKLFLYSKKYKYDKCLIILEDQVEIDQTRYGSNDSFQSIKCCLLGHSLHLDAIFTSKIKEELHNRQEFINELLIKIDEVKKSLQFSMSLQSRPIITVLFCIKVDSSNYATETVLSQELKTDGKWHLVVFFSKSLSSIEYNYKIHDKKILVII